MSDIKLEHYADQFKFSKNLFEDDFNHNQQLVVKTNNKGQDGSSVSKRFTVELNVFTLRDEKLEMHDLRLAVSFYSSSFSFSSFTIFDL